MSEKIFATGIYASAPHENAPEFVKAKISIKVAEAIAFLQENEKQSGYVDLDIKESKGGKWYVELNEYVPKERTQREPKPPGEVEYPQEDINPDDIPF